MRQTPLEWLSNALDSGKTAYKKDLAIRMARSLNMTRAAAARALGEITSNSNEFIVVQFGNSIMRK